MNPMDCLVPFYLTAITEERWRRGRLMTRFLELLEEEEEAPGPELPPNSVPQFVEDRREELIAAAIKFT
jgi:hypothetical protein